MSKLGANLERGESPHTPLAFHAKVGGPWECVTGPCNQGHQGSKVERAEGMDPLIGRAAGERSP